MYCSFMSDCCCFFAVVDVKFEFEYLIDAKENKYYLFEQYLLIHLVNWSISSTPNNTRDPNHLEENK